MKWKEDIEGSDVEEKRTYPVLLLLLRGFEAIVSVAAPALIKYPE